MGNDKRPEPPPYDGEGLWETSRHLRQPPANYEAERGLLGAIIMNNRAMEKVGEYLRPHHFADPANGYLYDACAQLIANGNVANPVTLQTFINASTLMEDVGGMKFLAGIAASAVTVINASEYGRLIYDLWLRREAIAVAQDMFESAFAGPMEQSFMESMEGIEGRILKITGTSDPEGGLVPFIDVLHSTYEQWERQQKGDTGVTTGFESMDRILGGLFPDDLIILAGRPSMGKTALVTSMAFNAAVYFSTTTNADHKDRQVAFFSLEMSKEQLGSRIITGQTKIQAPRNRFGNKMDQQEWEQAMSLLHSHGSLPFLIDDAVNQTIARMRGRCLRIHRKKKLGLIVVDYLQLMEEEVARGQQNNRVAQLSAITRGLKKLAKEFHCPVIALSQLSRGVENRDNKRPVLSDLRESGSIEQDADIVLFPYRQEYYLNQSGRPVKTERETEEAYSKRVGVWHEALATCENKCEVIVAKQRHGPLGSVDLDFESSSAWFHSAGHLKSGRPVSQEEMF